MKWKNNPKVMLFTSVVMTLIALIGGPVILYDQIIGQILAKGWPTVDGVITRGEVEETSSRRSVSYKARVWYDYQVDGVDHQGDRIRRVEMARSYDGALNRLRDFPVGSTVQVHYNPSRPSESLLEVGVSNESWFPAGFVVLLVAVTIGYWVATIRKFRAEGL